VIVGRRRIHVAASAMNETEPFRAVAAVVPHGFRARPCNEECRSELSDLNARGNNEEGIETP